MNFGEKIENTFPMVKWTGGSSIHRSIAADKNIYIPGNDIPKLMTVLVHGQYGEQLFGLLQELFLGINWMLSDDEFRAVALVDIYGHLTGQGDSPSHNKLTNPSTGNKFHRIGMKGNIVCGIRFWSSIDDNGNANVGFRFRLEELKAEELKDTDTVTKHARVKIEGAMALIDAVLDPMEIGEPTEQEAEKAKELVKVDG